MLEDVGGTEYLVKLNRSGSIKQARIMQNQFRSEFTQERLVLISDKLSSETLNSKCSRALLKK